MIAQPSPIQTDPIHFRAPRESLTEKANLADMIFTFPERSIEKIHHHFTVIPKAKRELRAAQDPVSALLTVLQGPYKEQLMQDMRHIAATLPEHLKEELLKQAALQGITQASEILSIEEITQIIRKTHADLPPFEEIAQRMALLSEHKYALETPPIQPNEKNPFLESIIKLLQTLKLALGLLELGKQPDSYFEADYLLGLFFKLILIPATLVSLLNLLLPAAASFAIVGIGIALFYTALHYLPDSVKLPKDCFNLTQQVREGKIPPIYGRDNEAQRLADALISRSHNKPVLKGHSQIGKTTIAKRFAQGVVNGEYPQLAGMDVIMLTTVDLIPPEMADHLAKRPLEKLLSALDKRLDNTIIFFDELQGATKREGVLSDQLKNRMTTYYFGAITDSDHDKLDAGLKNRFKTEIAVKDLSEKETIQIMERYAEREAPEYEFNADVFKKIYIDSTAKKVEQPQGSLDILSKLIVELRKGNEKVPAENTLGIEQKFNLFDPQFLLSKQASELAGRLQEDKERQAVQKKNEGLMRNALQTYGEYKKYLLQTHAATIRIARNPNRTVEQIKKFAFNLFFVEPLVSSIIKNLSKEHKLNNIVAVNAKNEIYIDRLKEKEVD